MRYTKEEQKVIVKCVQKYPQNLTQAFEEAASILPGRNKGSVSGHYYQKLKPYLDDQGFIVTQLSTVEGSINNAKTVARVDSAKVGMVKSLVSKLNSADQKKIAEFIFDNL